LQSRRPKKKELWRLLPFSLFREVPPQLILNIGPFVALSMAIIEKIFAALLLGPPSENPFDSTDKTFVPYFG
jgi:hypothetical protein